MMKLDLGLGTPVAGLTKEYAPKGTQVDQTAVLNQFEQWKAGSGQAMFDAIASQYVGQPDPGGGDVHYVWLTANDPTELWDAASQAFSDGFVGLKPEEEFYGFSYNDFQDVVESAYDAGAKASGRKVKRGQYGNLEAND